MANNLENGDPILLRCTTRSSNAHNGIDLTSISEGQSSELQLPSHCIVNDVKLGNGTEPGARLPLEETWHSNGTESLAVSVQNLYLSYEDNHPIISNLCMSVRKGTIYGLLGSSGCGKTSLLNCIVGLKKWDAGSIFVGNKRPGSKGSNGVPGAKVGYMPQDIALYDQLSVKEILEFYGRLYGMSEKEVAVQFKFLVEFLKLPSKFKLIKDFSGGQKRRVSLSIALIHSPELLILDEPTVGLDPLLRQSIWEYLYKMVSIRKSTVIITTHYIEEARFSNTIGVMRKGRLLVENSPNALLQQFGCILLEQVVLKLCQKAEAVAVGNVTTASQRNPMQKSSTVNHSKELNHGNRKIKSSKSKNSYDVFEKFQENWQLSRRRRSSINMDEFNEDSKDIGFSKSFQRIRSLSTVMWLLLFRHPVFTILTVFLPAFQILLTVAVIGKDPTDMKIGIVNEELPTLSNFCNINETIEDQTELTPMKLCDFKQLGCSFIAELNLIGSIETVPINSSELAYQQVKDGNLWGYIGIPSNYSQHLTNFMLEQRFARNETLEGSRIHIRMDMSNYLGAAIAIRSVFEAYENFVRALAFSCGLNPKEILLPIQFRKPVYGTNASSYHDYVTPIILIVVIFEIPMLVTSILYINDRKLGTLDRARVAGLRFKEIISSYMVTQGSIIIVQTALCYALVWLVYDFRVVGPMPLFFGVVLLCGVCGISLGLLFGIFFRDEIGVLLFGMFLAPTILLYEGVIWPLEAIPWIPWRIISHLFPGTLLCTSFRSIVTRGLDFTHPLVWPGIAVMSGHTILYLILSALLFRIRNK